MNTEQQVNFDTFTWTEIKVDDPGKPNNASNSLSELINEIKEPPPPVDTTLIDQMNADTEAKENTSTNGAPASEAAPGVNLGTGQSSSGLADAGQKMSANLLMKGFDTAFASAGVMITDRPEMYEYYKATEKDLKYLSESLAEVFAHYNWRMEPLTVFGIGLAGVYTTKGFQIYKDAKAAKQTPSELNQQIEVEKLRNEIAEIRMQKRTPPNVINPSKPGPRPGTKHRPGSQRPGPKPRKR